MHHADPKLCPTYESATPMLWELRPPRAGRRGAATAASRAVDAGDAADATPATPATPAACAVTPAAGAVTPAAGAHEEGDTEGNVEGHGEGVLDRQFARLSVSPMPAPVLPRHLLGRGAQPRGGDGGEGRRREAVASPSIAPGSEDRANPRKTRVPFGGRDPAADH